MASVHDVAQRCVRWYMSSGKQLKLDYPKPFGDQAAGQWMEDSNASLPAAVGAVVINNAAVMVEAGTASVARTWQAGTGFTDDGTAVLKDLRRPGGWRRPGCWANSTWTSSTCRARAWAATRPTRTRSPTTRASTEPHPDAASNTADVWFRSALFRTRDFRIRIQETARPARGAASMALAAIIRPYGRFQNPYRRIA